MTFVNFILRDRLLFSFEGHLYHLKVVWGNEIITIFFSVKLMMMEIVGLLNVLLNLRLGEGKWLKMHHSYAKGDGNCHTFNIQFSGKSRLRYLSVPKDVRQSVNKVYYRRMFLMSLKVCESSLPKDVPQVCESRLQKDVPQVFESL
jgi:hypothetical protein